MVSLETVKLLESKVTQTIDYVQKVTGENSKLSEENSKLKEKFFSYQKRIEELEILVQQFRENQSRIEDGILSALNRLNQFEDSITSTLSDGKQVSGEKQAPAGAQVTGGTQVSGETLPSEEVAAQNLTTPSPPKKADEKSSQIPVIVPEPLRDLPEAKLPIEAKLPTETKVPAVNKTPVETKLPAENKIPVEEEKKPGELPSADTVDGELDIF